MTPDAIMICIDDPRAALRIVALAQHAFPQARLLVRMRDLGHARALNHARVDYRIRETVESAYRMGGESLRALGFADIDVEEDVDDTRRRDRERLFAQVQGGEMSGQERLHIHPAPSIPGEGSHPHPRRL